MNKNISFDQNTVQILYTRHRANLIPTLIIMVCIYLFFAIVQPLIADLVKVKKEEDEQRAKNAILSQNIEFLNALDESTLDSQLEIASLALPAEQDYAGIINGISGGSVSSGVLLGDFSFGPLATPSAEAEEITGRVTEKPETEVNLSLKGDTKALIEFLKSMVKRFPLSGVSELEKSDQDETKMKISFFYKPFTPLRDKAITNLNPLTSAQIKLIEELRKLRDEINEIDSGLPSFAELNASPTPTPTGPFLINALSPTPRVASPSAPIQSGSATPTP